jgi:Ca2+-binding EF-hand superfamily protein
LQGEAIAYYGHLWEKYDSDGDGLMYLDEFTVMMQKQFGLPCPRDPRKRKVPGMNMMPGVQQLPAVEEIFNYADTEGNGFIDFNEFVGIMFDPDRLPTDKKRIYFKSAFSQIAGEDNKITMDELDAYFGGDQDTSELFAEMDNGDGIITFREFEKFVDKI